MYVVSALTVRRKWQYIRRTLLKTSYIIKLQNSDRYPDIKYMRDTICFNYKVLKKNKCPTDNTLFASDDGNNGKYKLRNTRAARGTIEIERTNSEPLAIRRSVGCEHANRSRYSVSLPYLRFKVLTII